ncbi:hypothetical protein ACLOJK_034585 [Asimina triloba]
MFIPIVENEREEIASTDLKCRKNLHESPNFIVWKKDSLFLVVGRGKISPFPPSSPHLLLSLGIFVPDQLSLILSSRSSVSYNRSLSLILFPLHFMHLPRAPPSLIRTTPLPGRIPDLITSFETTVPPSLVIRLSLTTSLLD